MEFLSLLPMLGAIAGPLLPSLIGGALVNRTTFYLMVGCALLGAASGIYITTKFWHASEKTAVVAQANQQSEQFRTVIKVEKVIQERIRVVREKGEEVIREVPVLIPAAAEQACPGGLPRGFIRVHDAAARNEPAGPAAVTDAHPSGIAVAAAGSAVAINYREFHTLREQVIGWNLFYDCLRQSKSPGDAEQCVAASGKDRR